MGDFTILNSALNPFICVHPNPCIYLEYSLYLRRTLHLMGRKQIAIKRMDIEKSDLSAEKSGNGNFVRGIECCGGRPSHLTCTIAQV